MIGPDATVTLDFALARMTGVMEKCWSIPGQHAEELDRLGGLIHSQRVLLALTQAGVSREDSTGCPAQRDAGLARRGRFPGLLKADPEVAAALAPEQIEACFDLDTTSSTWTRLRAGVRRPMSFPHDSCLGPRRTQDSSP